MLASLSIGLAGVGMLHLGGLSMPVAMVGVLLATVGLYNPLNEEDGPNQNLLFSNGDMSHPTSGEIPIGDNNDLSILHMRVENSLLSSRVAVKECIGRDRTYLSALLQEKNLFKSLMDIA